MSERLSAARVIEIGAELQRLQSRLAELDQERAVVQSEIERLLTELGSPPPSVAAAVPLFTRDKILATINANPEKTFTGGDFVRIWNARGAGATLMGFQSALSRLAAEKKIRRVKMGVYGALR